METYVQIRRSTFWLAVVIGVTAVGVIIGVIAGLAARSGVNHTIAMSGAFFAGALLLYPFLAMIADARSKEAPRFWRYAATAAAAWLIGFPLVYTIVATGLDRIL